MIKELDKSFRRDGLLYILIKRNEKVALWGIGGTYTDESINYEVSKIYIRDDQYGVRESIPSNEQFGRDLGRCFNDYELALNYYDELTELYQSMPKVISGEDEIYKLAV
jgi:hypothetical protein